MNIIVAVDNNWAIGLNGDMLVSIPADQKFFREMTMGGVVVMGRRTLECLPDRRPLTGRKNIVMTRKEDFSIKNAEVVHNVEELLETLKDIPTEDVYVIGGGEIYRELLPYCDMVHVTKIDHEYQADTWFPDLDKDPEWVITGDSDEQTYFNLTFEFLRYERKSKVLK